MSEVGMATAAETEQPDRTLVTRGAAYGLLARLLGPDPAALAAGSGRESVDVAALREALGELGDSRVLAALATLGERGSFDAETLAGRHSRLFDLAQAPPYELVYLPAGLGGSTARLADVSGFYRAFGFRVHKERPDHVVAELEFASFLALAEAQARRDGNEEGAEVCDAAMRKFLRDHLGGWLDAYAAKLEEADPGGPFGPVAAAAAAFVEADAARLGVEIMKPAVPAGVTPPLDEDDDAPLVCDGPPAPFPE